MKRALGRAAALLWPLALVALPRGADSQPPSDLAGDWLLAVVEGGPERTGILTLETSNEGIVGFVDGGPVPLTIDSDTIEFTIDHRDGGGRLLSRSLTGRIGAARMEGVSTPPLGAPPGSWHATPIVPPPSPVPPQPVDLSGVWSRTSSGMDKVSFDYTPKAQALVDAYSYLDDPALRCVSPGVVRVSGWPYPLEIVQTGDRVVILYEAFGEVRRIDLDGRAYPKDLPHRSMGYSLGHWEGSTLVVETEMLLPGFIDLAGQPLSENSRVVERISLSEDGQTLRSELTLYDPENYHRPITRHRTWAKTPETTILEYDCDPYPFFRGLALEGKLEEYWQRMRQRR
jgi:hypothetical protein